MAALMPGGRTGWLGVTLFNPSGVTGFGSIVSVDADPNVDGVATTAARSDHKHEVETAAPSAAVDIGDAAAIGVASELSRADHQHAVPAPVAAPPAVGTGAIGVATTPARSDHTHDGVESVDPNGAGAETGALTLDSPMLSSVGPAIRIDNANNKALPDPFVSADIDTDVNNSFTIPKLTGNIVVAIPTNTRQDRKITFKVTQGASAFTVGWTAGAGGYLFANSDTTLGVTQAQFDNELATMAEDEVLKIGFEYDGTLDRWLAVALAGPFA